jgi:hypothetical protein
MLMIYVKMAAKQISRYIKHLGRLMTQRPKQIEGAALTADAEQHATGASDESRLREGNARQELIVDN